MLLQLNDGNMIAPLSVFDVLDTVEEYLGTDVDCQGKLTHFYTEF